MPSPTDTANPPAGVSVKAPPTLAGQAAAGSVSGAIMVLVTQALWHFWGIELTNESTAAIMMLLPSVLHWLSRCQMCQKFIGTPPSNVVITSTSAPVDSSTNASGVTTEVKA